MADRFSGTPAAQPNEFVWPKDLQGLVVKRGFINRNQKTTLVCGLDLFGLQHLYRIDGCRTPCR
jgi:hypothetical protein